MSMTKSESIWMNGRWVPWDDARIHVLSHVAHYGSSVFEGIRCYKTHAGPAIFRLEDHIERLFFSARVYRMDVPYTREEVSAACVETVSQNRLDECYVRPLVYRGYDHVGVDPTGTPIEVAIAAYPWGKYLGADAQVKGVAVKVGTWARMAPNTLPAMAKAGGNYLNSQLLRLEANADGYAEAIALDVQGYVSEGSGENLFLVYRGEILTPPAHSSILLGITRETVFTLATELGYRVREAIIPREMLYLADELFFSGTAVEVTPITSVDRITVGRGERGPVTKAVQDAFFGIVRGEQADRHRWLHAVPQRAGAPAGAAIRQP
ncbi:MAG: branched-chain amino acid transaminase [Candidatus Eisenbacteria bacterium]|nr:branched-chain amino acid transaminase [Candidatus Eisenbacteria bacterium]